MTELIIQTATETKLNTGHLNITTNGSLFYWAYLQEADLCLSEIQNQHIIYQSLFGNKQSFSPYEKEAVMKMESKGNRNSFVLMFGFHSI